jgi:Fe-S cluster assembly iron-binding protein IscA
MITVTPQAALALRAALLDSDGPDQAIRVIASRDDADAISMRLEVDGVRPDDKKIEFQGAIILIARPSVAELLSDRTLSLEETRAGASFRLRPTQAAERGSRVGGGGD